MHTSRGPLVDALAELAPNRAVEVGIGDRLDVAAALSERGRRVTATDVVDRSVPEGVTYRREDVTDPDPSAYAGVDLVYALNCPPELQSPLVDLADAVGARWAFTTLGADPAVVAASPRTVGNETLFVARSPAGPTRR